MCLDRIDSFWKDADGYISVGGLGDSLLVLAFCHDNPRAKVVLFTMRKDNRLVKLLFELMRVPLLVENINCLRTHLSIITSWQTDLGLIPPGLNYDGWIPKIKTSLPLKSKLGIWEARPAGPMLIFCPGSSDTNRSLSKSDYLKLASFLAIKFTVFVIGSEAQRDYYGIPSKVKWLTAEGIGGVTLFQVINSCDLVIAVDTFVKTYSYMAGIPTIVIDTGRHHGEEMFLSPKIWPKLRIVNLSDLLKITIL